MRSSLSLVHCLSAVAVLTLSGLLHAGAISSPVADASMQGNGAAVRDLLKQGGDVNAAQGDGMTALHWAAARGDADLAQVLVHAGANLRAATRLNGYTPLILASQSGHTAVIDVLLKAGADAKAATLTGTTPLMFAAASGATAAVTLLLDTGADVNARESVRQQTAVMFAAAYNRAPMIDLLAKRGADLKATTKVTDFYAASKANEEAKAKEAGDKEAGSKKDAPARPLTPGVDRAYTYNELMGYRGGFTALLLAARDGHMEAVKALLDAGAAVDEPSAGDKTTPLLIAAINGRYDVAKYLLDRGASPNVAGENGEGPLYATLNAQWAPKSHYPQPTAYLQQRATYLELLNALLQRGADPNVRLKKKVWHSQHTTDQSGVDEVGATPFWRAAYACDVDAMRLLVKFGADPNVPTTRPAEKPKPENASGLGAQKLDGLVEAPSRHLPPVPVGGPSVTPLLAGTGVGYAEGFAANSHRIHPGGWMPAVKYLVEELGADVNARDHDGNTPLHNAAARGDAEMILYLVSKGADVKAVNRVGQTTADMANGPFERTQPYPEAVALLEKLGAKNNHKCVSC